MKETERELEKKRRERRRGEKRRHRAGLKIHKLFFLSVANVIVLMITQEPGCFIIP